MAVPLACFATLTCCRGDYTDRDIINFLMNVE